MLVKWADFVITGVGFNDEHTHIEKVERYEYISGKLVNKKVVTRQIVVNAIQKGITYATATKNSEGKWKRGSFVKITTFNGIKYLRTTKDNTEKDNLGNLPELEN